MSNRFLTWLSIIFTFVFLVGCKPAPDHFTMDDFGHVEKIDVHVHVNSADPAFIDQARADNFKLLTINVEYPDFPPIDDQQNCALTHKQNHPEAIAFATTFSMTAWNDPDWQQKVTDRLDDSFARGAVAVKVWKNIGMEFRASDGKLVMIDDPKFDAVFQHIGQQQKVLIGHQGEPKNCWLPIDAMTVNNDKGYFKNHPQYHMFLHPEMPSYEDQMAARDRMLEKNREIHFIGAHLASLEWSVDEVAKFLDRFPNATVDLAARMGQVQYQSSRDREKVRSFFIKYQDRILYATDLTQAPNANADEFKKEVHEKWLADWKYFNTDSTMSVPELDESFQALALPKNVVEKIYRSNALRFFPNAWKKSGGE